MTTAQHNAIDSQKRDVLFWLAPEHNEDDFLDAIDRCETFEEIVATVRRWWNALKEVGSILYEQEVQG